MTELERLMARRASREKWRKKNMAKHASYFRKWVAVNKDKRKIAMARWEKENRPRLYAAKAKRMANKVKATPAWANQFFIAEIYDLATLRTKCLGQKYSVDHIVPMKSDLVCGLHVEHNLRAIPHLSNISKKNRWWPDMP